MIQHLIFDSNKLYFREIGKGKTVVLLHGYLESIHIWDDFQSELAKSVHTIAIDLLGHGNSDTPHQTSVEYIAKQVCAVLDCLNIKTCTLIGHSMGGYAGLAFAELYSNRLDKLILLNSHPFVESESRKKGREREIELVKKGKKNLLVNLSIGRSFTKTNSQVYKLAIKKCLEIALNTKDQAVIGAIKAIVDKPDRQDVIRKLAKPVLILHGMDDENLDQYKAESLDLPTNSVFVPIENCAHMGMIEARDVCLFHIHQFIHTPFSN